MVMPEITGQTISVDSKKTAADLKKLPITIVVSLLFLTILSVGVVVSLAMVSRSQDLRRAASTNVVAENSLTAAVDSYPPPCIYEGGKASIIDGTKPQCCSGLTQITGDKPDTTGQCMRAEGAIVCTKCGDGVCGLGENYCNCSQDCKAPQPTATPTPTQGPLKCDWCGTECLPVDAGRSCILIAPPIGYSCGVSVNGQRCEKQKIGCIRKSACMFEDPACEIKLQPNYVFCADSDLNGDSLVNQSDFDLLSMHFFDSSPADLMYDINHDKKIDIFDYSVMVKEWTR